MKNCIYTIVIAACLSAVAPVFAQVANGGQFTLDQAVLASGGGKSTAGNLTIDGTIGQSVAGQRTSQPPRSVHAGFWQPPDLGPTAATVAVSGRVMTSDGRGIRNATLRLTDSSGITRTVRTGTFGYYSFDGVLSGGSCVVSISARHFVFSPADRLVNLHDSVEELDFTAVPN